MIHSSKEAALAHMYSRQGPDSQAPESYYCEPLTPGCNRDGHEYFDARFNFKEGSEQPDIIAGLRIVSPNRTLTSSIKLLTKLCTQSGIPKEIEANIISFCDIPAQQPSSIFIKGPRSGTKKECERYSMGIWTQGGDSVRGETHTEYFPSHSLFKLGLPLSSLSWGLTFTFVFRHLEPDQQVFAIVGLCGGPAKREMMHVKRLIPTPDTYSVHMFSRGQYMRQAIYPSMTLASIGFQENHFPGAVTYDVPSMFEPLPRTDDM